MSIMHRSMEQKPTVKLIEFKPDSLSVPLRTMQLVDVDHAAAAALGINNHGLRASFKAVQYGLDNSSIVQGMVRRKIPPVMPAGAAITHEEADKYLRQHFEPNIGVWRASSHSPLSLIVEYALASSATQQMHTDTAMQLFEYIDSSLMAVHHMKDNVRPLITGLAQTSMAIEAFSRYATPEINTARTELAMSQRSVVFSPELLDN